MAKRTPSFLMKLKIEATIPTIALGGLSRMTLFKSMLIVSALLASLQIPTVRKQLSFLVVIDQGEQTDPAQ